MLGLDVDNDSAFINQTVVDYGKERKIELTRSRGYKKNDQAWIEQKKWLSGQTAGGMRPARRCGGR